MKKFCICFIALFISSTTSEECINCVQRENCEEFGNLSVREQKEWVLRYPCPVVNGQKYGNVFGFAANAKGDNVCCSSVITAFGSNQNEGQLKYNQYNNYGNRNDLRNGNAGLDPGHHPNVPYDNTNNWGPDNTFSNHNYINNGVDNQNGGNPGYNNGGYNGQSALPPYEYPHVNPPPKNYSPANHNPYVTSSPINPGGHNFDNTGPSAQCPITSFPPKSVTGCCGREASDTDRIVVPHSPIPRRTPPQTIPPNQFGKPSLTWADQGLPRYGTPFARRVSRSTANDIVNVTIGNRIAGGRATEFEQFPWTVLLRTTFDYGNKRTTFDCGGSLISSRYVLTAGHCVFDTDGKIIKVEVFLAEYDKRTFPKDCKIVLGRGEKCIENVVIEAESVVLHAEYNDSQLKNDIALIRLREDAPYTNYMRPICLPSIDVDTPDFLNLRLAVAGWGRNGRYRSDIKQSTIVNLVPQEKCQKFYPGLSRGQVCAAGYRGEDTCKGDSGGPLMVVYSGKYQVVGVVSGKRADSPCGTAVPSLYTNVYHYLDWIYSNIKN